jgi:hypothetical protein
VHAGGKIEGGLVNRRKAEEQLFTTAPEGRQSTAGCEQEPA